MSITWHGIQSQQSMDRFKGEVTGNPKKSWLKQKLWCLNFFSLNWISGFAPAASCGPLSTHIKQPSNHPTTNQFDPPTPTQLRIKERKTPPWMVFMHSGHRRRKDPPSSRLDESWASAPSTARLICSQNNQRLVPRLSKCQKWAVNSISKHLGLSHN
jgi:hypothetical protein